ncbi:MAG: hypothetical protein IPM35_17955 [Myxococcales bacterium]|nr:hypothetical protein [Myxococcales bacterium]
MTERASKPAEPGKAGPTHLETVEFEPGAFNDLAPEDIERLKRGEALPPRAPVPVAGGDGREVPPDATPIDLPVQAAAYEGPRELPGRTNHNTFEMQTVAVEPELDPRKAPTQRKLRSPVEKDTIRDLVRREPTLRGLHAGAPGADEAPPSAGPAPVVVPGPESPPAVADDEPRRPTPAKTGGKVWVVFAAVAALIIVAVIVGSRKPDAEPAPAATAQPTVPQALPVARPSAEPAVPLTASAEPSPPAPPVASVKPKPVKSGAPTATLPSPSVKAPAPPDPDRPFL